MMILSILAGLARASRAIRLGAVAFLLLASNAFAADATGYTIVDDMLIYYAVVPAEMVRTFPPGSAEARMHGGVPDGRHMHHIQVAVLDAKTNERITDARVTATITELGFAGQEVVLEPFTVADALTYGAYFEFGRLATYSVDLRIERPGAEKTTETQFDYRHH